MVQSLILNYQCNYNSNSQSQYKYVRNQLMFSQCSKTGYCSDETKEDKQKPRINLDHITWNDFGEMDHYTGKSECSTQMKLKEDTEASRKTKQGKSGNKPPDGGGEQNNWWMLKMHHAVSWWEFPLKNEIVSHLLGWCSAIPRHKKSFIWNLPQIKTNKCSCAAKKFQHNMWRKHHPGFCSRIQDW